VPAILVLIVDVVAPVLQSYVTAPVPPLGVAVRVAGNVLEHAVGLLTETVGFGSIVTVPEPEPVQPFVSVTVTEYVPALLVLIVDVVAPVLHAKVDAPVPPLGVAVSVAGRALAHTSGLLTETVGLGSTVSVPEPDPVQPFVSVTVTEYVPAVLVLIVDVVAPVLQAKVDAPVPPLGVAVRVAGNELAHEVGLFTETVGLGSTVSVPVPEPVQPFVSVTVTEYVPAVLVLIVEVVPPVLQANVFDPVPPAGVAVNVAGNALVHASTSATETVGFGFTVRVPAPVPVQPFVSVTVTL
jgi:hypothetical protein